MELTITLLLVFNIVTSEPGRLLALSISSLYLALSIFFKTDLEGQYLEEHTRGNDTLGSAGFKGRPCLLLSPQTIAHGDWRIGRREKSGYSFCSLYFFREVRAERVGEEEKERKE